MSPGDSANLILTGFMGVGKTRVGWALAAHLDRDFVDMDDLISDRAGMPISRIFAEHGEEYFRVLEAALCRELAARSRLVIATGGGALIPKDNYRILAASGQVVCLNASVEEILDRVGSNRNRPLLEVSDRRARITRLLEERAAAYGRIPRQVETTGLGVAQVMERVLAMRQVREPTVLDVRHPGGEYPLYLGQDMLSRAGEVLAEQGISGDVVVVTNPTVGDLYGEKTTQALEKAGLGVKVCTVPDGEAYKTLETVRGLYDGFVAAGLDRQGTVVALGGGVIGDMAGFAAATYLRGVRLVQIPTTLLSMVDSSVGGKVAVDHPQGKNLIGAFKQPELVLADPAVLSTLPASEFASGMGEVVKTAVIGDRLLFEQIEAYGPAPLSWIVERSVQVKADVVEKDPYERGRRAVLNLGHTFGHALELLSGYTLSHGQAVGIGLVAAACLSARMGWGDEALAARLERVLQRLDLPVSYAGYPPETVWQAMATDKKRRGNRLRFVLPRAVGDCFVTDEVEQAEVVAVLEEMRG